ncbi:uncharacterized protein LOC132169598 [Corylus avellana]|uniref:uncharacterized protein LOC132169598 n=1 Tax=Corylus avellana TaxID=13451 RepID=UPI00286C04A6|nr:uncharacterized protein LOC132169598 [Corylus avellana]
MSSQLGGRSHHGESSHTKTHHSRSQCSHSHHARSHLDKPVEAAVHKDVKDLQEKFEKMAFLIENGENWSATEHLMQHTNLPFTDRVMRFPMPSSFKVLRIGEYDGSGDPSDHMESFRAHIILHETLDEIACRAFPLTLRGVAKEWFGSLSPKSVDNFDYLGQQFLGQFLAVQRRKKNPAYLLSLVQGKNESLNDYLLRFNWGKLAVESTDEQTILSVLMHGTLRQFNSKAEEFINQEETISALLKSKAAENKPATDPGMMKPKVYVEKKKKDRQNPKILERKVDIPPRPNQHQQYVEWTPLNTTVYKVFMEVKKDPSFRWPGRMKPPPQNRNTRKFCEYHNDHGHQTEDCISLRFEIEKFLRNGKLLNFLVEENGKGKSTQDGQGQHSGQNNDRSCNQSQRCEEQRVSRNQQQNPQN